MIGLSEAVIQSCVFIPNDSQRHNNACLKYWTTRDMTHGCIFTPANLVFTGRTTTFQDEYLITVNTTDLITKEAIEIWVQRKDGICLNNCCHVPVKSTRFLLDARCPGDWFCLNGGNCINHHCSCTQGYYGDYCGKYCSPDPCNNHGRCSNSAAGYTCTCNVGYNGRTCGRDCSPDPCSGHGTCGNSASGYTCTCNVGYSGTKCDKDCLPNRCSTHGRCHNKINGYSCSCNTGYEGTHCERDCLPDPCHGHGSCFNSITGYLCSCNAGYTGTSCNNHCSPDPCNGHGTCHYTQIGFTCSCSKGYTGQTCASEKNTILMIKFELDCSSNPCHGHGDCYNGAGGHLCQCHSGYSGINCQTAATKQPIVGSGHHVCDKMGLLMDLATGKSVTMQNAKACGGNSSDAVILKHCQSPIFSKWKKGIQVFILNSLSYM
ncbi:unnamed protein product [Mytilus edulis]|uniref:EGF-like domain-containing protein n=1 Tax=Mytilus edulis TaxID=6550 RepID=A0A8S3T639_MYTED|nr:unnamed protein product [Mytilus edulis]